MSKLKSLRMVIVSLNRDRKYTVSEFRKYISERVVHLSGGQRVPTSREENLKHDFRTYYPKNVYKKLHVHFKTSLVKLALKRRMI